MRRRNQRIFVKDAVQRGRPWRSRGEGDGRIFRAQERASNSRAPSKLAWVPLPYGLHIQKKDDYICLCKYLIIKNYIINILKTQIMKELIDQMKETMAAILADIDKVDVKAAKARVRKQTILLERLGKQYRKESLK